MKQSINSLLYYQYVQYLRTNNDGQGARDRFHCSPEKRKKNGVPDHGVRAILGDSAVLFGGFKLFSPMPKISNFPLVAHFITSNRGT